MRDYLPPVIVILTCGVFGVLFAVRGGFTTGAVVSVAVSLGAAALVVLVGELLK